ncbi:hypothetical protein LP417_21770 [Polaromonas sp. P1-6]|nr:hypothetical protein LP417_21770 [Polaromonas sp. P1-6]
MTRTASLYNAAMVSALMLACRHSFAFVFTPVVMKTAGHANYSEGKKFSEELSGQPSTVAAAGSIEVAFSPNEGSEALGVKVINSAQLEIRVLSYSFSPTAKVKGSIQYDADLDMHPGAGISGQINGPETNR